MLKKAWSLLPTLLWALLILVLPITSLPLISRLAGGLMVAPPALLAAGALAVIWLLPHLIRRGNLAGQSIPLFWFILAAAISSLLAFFIFISPFREVSRLTNSLSGFVTLLIGVTFYLLAATWPITSSRLNFLLRLLNWSALPMLAWALAQSAAWELTNDSYPDWMWNIQRIISSSGALYNWRTTGLAYEPSWLGHQLVMLYLPWWLAAAVQRTSAHRFRLFRMITFEHILLALGLVVLYLSFARGALASFLLMVTFLILKATFWLIGWLRARIMARRPGLSARKSAHVFVTALITLGFGLVYLAGLVGAAYVYTRTDERMADLGSMLHQGVNFADLAHGLFFGERVAFWQTGLEIFSDHPIVGVGLNNAGFFFPQKMTPYAWTLAEPYKMIYSSALPNTLSLWVRLLSETGIVGFSLFAAFIYLLWQSSFTLKRSSSSTLRVAGLAGQLVLIGLMMEGLSLDTFAMPYYWISLGWLTAACNIERQVPASA